MTSRSAPVGCRWRSPGSRPCASPLSTTPRRSRRSLRTSPRSAPAPPSRRIPQYDVSGVSNADIAKGGEFFRTNCTACHNFAGAGGALPRGKFAPKLTGVSEKHIFEALLTGPQQMPVFSNGVLTPADKRDIIAYLKKNEKTPAYGGFTIGSLGPVSEGLFAWLAGIGTLTGAAVWIASSTTRSKKKVTR